MRSAEQVNSRGWRRKPGQEVLVKPKPKKLLGLNRPVTERMLEVLQDGHSLTFEPADYVEGDFCDEGVLCYLDDHPGSVEKTIKGALTSAQMEAGK
jgi:hypothetical protein